MDVSYLFTFSEKHKGYFKRKWSNLKKSASEVDFEMNSIYKVLRSMPKNEMNTFFFLIQTVEKFLFIK